MASNARSGVNRPVLRTYRGVGETDRQKMYRQTDKIIRAWKEREEGGKQGHDMQTATGKKLKTKELKRESVKNDT